MTRAQLMTDFELAFKLDTSHKLNPIWLETCFSKDVDGYLVEEIQIAFWAWCKSRENTLLEGVI